MSLLGADGELGRQKQAGLYEFKESLVCRASSMTARATQRNTITKQNKTPRVVLLCLAKESSRDTQEISDPAPSH